MADCALCGCRWINGYMGCSRPNCNEYRLVTECNEWPVSLALSIRRFVRRAEVEGLRGVIVASATRYAMATRNSAAVLEMEASEEFDTALSRLAALAMEVEP